MIFGDITKKVDRYVQELADPLPQKRLKAVENLAQIAAQDPKPVRHALPAIAAAVGDVSGDVRAAALRILKSAVKSKSIPRKEMMAAILDAIPGYSGNIAEALEFLKKHASSAKEPFEERLPGMVDLLENGDERTRNTVALFLEEFGLPANSYAAGMAEARLVLDDAERCGAELTKARYMLGAARTGMKKGFYDEMSKTMDLAKVLANCGRKVVRLWKVPAPGARAIDIAPGAKYVCACGSDRKLYLIDISGQTVWCRSIPEGATTVAFSPDGERILAGGGDCHLYCINLKGEDLWKYRMSATASSICLADNGMALVCGGDNNLYFITSGGALAGKHWTEKPGYRLSISGDGEYIMLTYRDHNVYCYDRQIFLRWKFMGGIWNDVKISRDGETAVAGSQGSDLVLFSKIGSIVWKARTDEPVLSVSISSDGECIYSADTRSVVAYNRVGKPMFRYNTREPILSMCASTSGEYVATAFQDRIVLMRNREMARQSVLHSPILLESVQRMGVDVEKPAALFAKARGAYESQDYEKGTELASEGAALVEAAKSQKAGELVSSVRGVMDDARAFGADITKSEAFLKLAQDSLKKAQVDRVILLIGQARDEAEIARRVREGVLRAEKDTKSQAVRKAIQDAIALTDDAVEYGMDSGEVETLLQSAIASADKEEWEKSMLFLRQLEEVVRVEKVKLPEKVATNLRDACEILKKDAMSNEEVEKARSNLSGAIVYYDKSGDLRKLAESYERLGFLEERREKIPYSKFLYQKAVNTYFKVGEIDQVLMLLVERMKRLEAITDKKVYEYTIEELFLIFKDGRLILHNTRRLRPDVDNQVLGGMLVAIQNFVGESFKEKDGELLDELRYGKTRILVERGAYVYLALVISGQEPEEKRAQMKKLIADIEEKYRNILDCWDGDTSKLWGTKKMVETLLSVI